MTTRSRNGVWAIGAIVVTCAAVLATAASTQSAKPSSDTDALIAELRADVARLKDREQIHQVYVHYGRGIDRLDERAYRSAFWPDAQINYGTLESITPEQHWASHMLKGHKGRQETWAHLLTNETVDVDGDIAHVEIYVTRFAVPKNPTESRPVWSGRYIDRLERRNGEWRIAVREFIPHFAMKAEIIYHENWDPLFKNARLDCFKEAFAPRDTSFVRPLERRKSTQDGPPCAK